MRKPTEKSNEEISDKFQMRNVLLLFFLLLFYLGWGDNSSKMSMTLNTMAVKIFQLKSHDNERQYEILDWILYWRGKKSIKLIIGLIGKQMVD